MAIRNLEFAQADSQYAVETFSLTKIFTDWWGRNKVVAVEDLDLRVRYNEVFGLLGPNGSGKTTTLKVLLSLLHPTKGKFLVLGGNSRDPKISARIGFLPEESYLYKYLSARETLNFYGRLFGLNAKLRKMRTEALLEMVGLQGMANRPVGTFSKGMARRIGLAQALINDPELLILDEPTAGLDPIGTRQIKELIKELARRGKTVLLCSHLLADVEDVCNRIAILYGGRLQSQGEVGALLQRVDKKQITTSRLSDEATEKIKQIVKAESGQCEITSPMERLETLFIKIVAEAEQQAQPTSGAVSTTKIGDFLAAKAAGKSILDKLVSVEPSRAGASAEPVRTEKVQEVQVEQDNELLEKLAEAVEPVTTEAAREANPPPVEDVEHEQVDENILDELTGRRAPREPDAEQPGKKPRTGGAEDA